MHVNLLVPAITCLQGLMLWHPVGRSFVSSRCLFPLTAGLAMCKVCPCLLVGRKAPVRTTIRHYLPARTHIPRPHPFY